MAADWFTRIDGKIQGPFDGRGLKMLAQNGHLKPSDQVRRGEDGAWLAAKQVNGLFGSSSAPVEAKPAAPAQSDPTTLVNEFGDLADEIRRVIPSAERRARGGWVALLISLLALLVAGAALALPFVRDPLGKGVSGYDFATPEAAAKSMTRIQMGRDIRAQMELGDLRRGGTPEEVYRTFEVNRVADFGDKKVVFVSYMRKSKKRKELLEFEKDLESKLWLPTHLSPFEVNKTDEKLAKEMEAWTEGQRDLD